MKKFLIAAAALVALVGCQKDITVTPEGTMPSSIVASFEQGGARVAIADDNALTWTAGDGFTVFDEDFTKEKAHYVIDPNDAGKASAQFNLQGNNVVENPACALFPTTALYEGGEGDGRIAMELANEVSSFALPMVAVTNTLDHLSFKHLCAVLRVRLANIPAGFDRIIVTASNPISGNFTASIDDVEPVLVCEDEPLYEVTVRITEEAEEQGVVYMPLPVGDYGWLSIAIGNETETHELKSWSNLKVKRAKIYSTSLERAEVADLSHITDNEELAEAFVEAVNNPFKSEIKLPEGGQLVLTEPITFGAPVSRAATTTEGREFTLDLNGCTISQTLTELTTLENGKVAPHALITNLGNLTIIDSKGSGKITLTCTATPDQSVAVNTISNKGNLVINGGEITNVGNVNQIGYAIDNYWGSSLTVNGGTIAARGSTAYDAIRLFCSSTNPINVTVNGGEISSIWAQNPTANKATEVLGTVVINGGTAKVYYERFTTVKVKRGVTTATVIPYGEGSDKTRTTTEGDYTVYGFILPGNVHNAEELAAAIEAGGKHVLANNIEVTRAFSLTNKEFTLNGNGYTISQAEGCVINIALFDVTGGVITLKNVKFDGIKTGAVLRTVGATANLDGVVVENGEHTGEHTKGQGLLRLYGTSTILNSTFKNNTCNMVITHNYDPTTCDEPLRVENCVFEKNTCKNIAVVYYVKGSGATINKCKFLNNTATSAGNAATLYLGFEKNCTATNNVFDGNKVTTTGASKRVAGAIMVGNAATIKGNAFINNTVTSSNAGLGNDVCASIYYASIDLSGNYWGGGAPIENDDYFVEYPNRGYSVIINDYLTTYQF